MIYLVDSNIRHHDWGGLEIGMLLFKFLLSFGPQKFDLALTPHLKNDNGVPGNNRFDSIGYQQWRAALHDFLILSSLFSAGMDHDRDSLKCPMLFSDDSTLFFIYKFKNYFISFN